MSAVLWWLVMTGAVVLIAIGRGDLLIYAPLVVMAVCVLSGFRSLRRDEVEPLFASGPSAGGAATLRLVASTAGGSSAPHTLATEPTGSYRRAMIVEDEPVLRRVLARNLVARGLQVRVAQTAAQAVAELETRWPDLMLLDINLPDRSGWDVMREMRRRDIAVPTIVLSAVRVSQSRLDEFAPLAFLPKPFPMDALLRLVTGTVGDVDASTTETAAAP